MMEVKQEEKRTMIEADKCHSSNKEDPPKKVLPAGVSDTDGGDEVSSSSSVSTHSTKGGPATKPEPQASGYKDYSRFASVDGKSVAASMMVPTPSSKEPTFPVKLHLILSNPDFQDIISWLPHGRSWRILQQKSFEERVIPLYFRHGRYSSFARQVNGWGFRRITHGSDYNSYYHELFLRGMPQLCERMKRLTSKDITKRKKAEDESAPDFYALAREKPLPELQAVLAQQPPGAVPGIGGRAFGIKPMGPPSHLGGVVNAERLARANQLVAPPLSAAGHLLGGSPAVAEMELLLLDRRRAEIMEGLSGRTQNAGGIVPNEARSSSSSAGLSGVTASSLLGVRGLPSAPSYAGSAGSILNREPSPRAADLELLQLLALQRQQQQSQFLGRLGALRNRF